MSGDSGAHQILGALRRLLRRGENMDTFVVELEDHLSPCLETERAANLGGEHQPPFLVQYRRHPRHDFTS